MNIGPMVLGLGLGLGMLAPLSAQEPPRERLTRPEPLDREVDVAVAKGVEFLAKQQRESGGWHVELYSGDATSTTSLAMMALLAAGHVPGEEPHANVFRRGITYLLARQNAAGLIVDKTGHGPLYCHGISTLFLAEVIGMAEPDQSEAVRTSLERAVRALLQAQAVNKGDQHAGGWRYTLTSRDSDLSVTAWQLLALRAAKNAGCDVPASAIDRAVDYVRRCAPRHEPGFAYQPGNGSSPVMTAAGVTALQVCGASDQPECVAAVEALGLRRVRPEDRYYLYGTYYASVALHQQGGDIWPARRDNLFRELLRQQEPDGRWLGRNESERSVGPVYATALAILALTVEYGYLPIYQK